MSYIWRLGSKTMPHLLRKHNVLSIIFMVCVAGILGANPSYTAPSMDFNENLYRETCPEDYAPCSCSVSSGELSVVCSEVSVQEVIDVFNRTTARELDTFGLQWTRTPLESVTIPADLLGGSRAKLIGVYCPSKVVQKVPLRMDDNAFNLSRDYADTFLTFYCDWSQQIDLQFLAGFKNLAILEIGLATELQAIGRLPTLPALTTLHVMDSTGLVEFPDLSPSILKTLFLNGNQMNDTMGEKLLDSIIATPTIRLSTLRLNSNRLTRIPTRQITSFPELQNIYLDDNEIRIVETGSFSFLFPVTILSLQSASINTIQPDAFQGDFTMATVNLSNNNLTRFESAVFLKMLNQMNLPFADGYVDLKSNIMECDCGLAWLIRDNRILMPAVRNGLCSNGIAFENLDPALFAGCPEIF